MQRLNTLLTIVSNVAVIAGIVFLALEIRQNTIATKAQIYQERAFHNAATMIGVAESEYVMPVQIKLRMAESIKVGVESLTVEERSRLIMYELGQLRSFENNLYQCHLGYLEQDFCEVFKNRTKELQKYWEELLDGQVPPEFVLIRAIHGGT